MKPRRTRKVILLVLLCLLACTALAACVVENGTMGSQGSSLSDMVASGLSIQAERGTKVLNITRPEQTAKKPANLKKNSWTVFVYLCGSDLETKTGAATKDLTEMLSASAGDNITFVVETGGAKKWQSNIRTNSLSRYVIKNGSISEVGTLRNANMGDGTVLADFLTWGIENYPAENMGVILWDHGAGSITGVCFDEHNNYDAIALSELDKAFATANAKLWEKFEFVGFDACLMSTLETANVLASYAKYMIASQETEPATGWEYSSLVHYLAQNPTSNGADLGRALCDNYLSTLPSSSAAWATLAVIDLSKIDELVQSFYRFSQEMYASGSNQSTLAAMTRGIKQAENYGSNNRLEGYTNMVDLYGIVSACADVTPSAADVKAALDAAVVYQVRGKYHSKSCGLSTYYPLAITDAKELSTFQKVAVNPSYLSYIDRLVHGGTYNGGSEYVAFPDDTWFQDGIWNWSVSEGEQAPQSEEYWNYVNQHSDESQVITLAQEPQLDDEGSYWFQLDQHGIDNAAVVSALLFTYSSDGNDVIALGETYDVYGDWETGTFTDNFNGKWLSLPDGQNLCLYVAEHTNDYVTYTSPITLNGEERFLRLTQDLASGDVTVEGTWSAIGQNGAVDRGVTPLKRGDVIVPRYDAISTQNNAKSLYEGNPYTVADKTLHVDYSSLPANNYLYSFRIQDVFGDSHIANSAEFEIDKDGTIYFFE
ncbi:MAG: clostripain-related cysteine peptidase [Atopobiaceae bacterium]|nr:clostripain-related cysteine peptidase [Atopobiaceae bacterium]